MSLIPEIKFLLGNIKIKGNKYDISTFKDDNVNYSYAYLLNAVHEYLINDDIVIEYLEYKKTECSLHWLIVFHLCIKDDIEEALKLLKSSVSNENTYRYFASYYNNMNDYINAFKYHTLSFEKHNSLYSAYRIGWYYYRGSGIPQDYKKAFEHFKLSETLPESAYLIGTYYENGFADIKQDIKKAYEYYKKSADDGDLHAQYNVGLSYLSGKICANNNDEIFENYEQNDAKGLKYLILSAKQNNSMSIIHLAYCYLCGKHTKIDYRKALEYFRLYLKLENDDNHLGNHIRPSFQIPICESKLIELYKALCSEEDYTFAYDLYTKHKDPYANVLQNNFRNTYRPYLIYFVKDIADIILAYLF